MDNFDTKIKKIKNTIDDIKFDIDAIKQVNSKSLN